MDDARIRELTEEVLRRLREPGAEASADLERRVAALERAVRALQAGSGGQASLTVVHASTPATARLDHASHELLGPGGGSTGHCVLEPGKPCSSSGQCRSFGH